MEESLVEREETLRTPSLPYFVCDRSWHVLRDIGYSRHFGDCEIVR